MELVGLALPEGELDEMAECLVEEFVRMGLDDARLLHLFQSPFYAGSHRIYQQKGEAYVRSLIERVRARWSVPQTTYQGEAQRDRQ